MKKLSQNLSDCGVCAARIILLEDQLGFMRCSAFTQGRSVARCPGPYF